MAKTEYRELFDPCHQGYHDHCAKSYRVPGVSGGTVGYQCACGCHDDDKDAWRNRARCAEADLAAAEAQVARLQAALRDALDDLEARDELSAMDGLRAALATGEPSAEPSAKE